VNQQPSLYDINITADQIGKDGNSMHRAYVAKRPRMLSLQFSSMWHKSWNFLKQTEYGAFFLSSFCDTCDSKEQLFQNLLGITERNQSKFSGGNIIRVLDSHGFQYLIFVAMHNENKIPIRSCCKI
jgi:hypothetical protein